MEQRLIIAKSKNTSFQQPSDIFEIFFHDAKFQEIFLPLFNYNIRKLAKNFTAISNKLDVEAAKSFLKLKEQASKYNIKSAYMNGLRGVFYAMVIQALLEKDNLRPVLLYDAGDEIDEYEIDGHKYSIRINPARILLTIIHSLTNYKDNDRKKENLTIGLAKVYIEFRKMFKDARFIDVFFGRLEDLFLLYKYNWCHLITFRKKQVYRNSFEDEKRTLREKIANGDNFDFLDAVEVRINRSAHVSSFCSLFA